MVSPCWERNILVVQEKFLKDKRNLQWEDEVVASAVLFLYAVICYGVSPSFLVLFAGQPLVKNCPHLTAWK